MFCRLTKRGKTLRLQLFTDFVLSNREQVVENFWTEESLVKFCRKHRTKLRKLRLHPDRTPIGVNGPFLGKVESFVQHERTTAIANYTYPFLHLPNVVAAEYNYVVTRNRRITPAKFSFGHPTFACVLFYLFYSVPKSFLCRQFVKIVYLHDYSTKPSQRCNPSFQFLHRQRSAAF